MAVYVVTGGAGFIGSHIVERLAHEGQDVRVLDDLSTGLWTHLERMGGRVSLFEGDICDQELLGGACEGADFVLHHAAVADVARSLEDPVAANRVNVEGTVRVLSAAVEAGVRRVVYASSSAVYGDSPDQPKREDTATAPLSPYAASKLAGEHFCRAFAEVFGLSVVALRYFNVYGARQNPSGPYAAVIPVFIRCLLEGLPPQIYGDGEQTRDFVAVEDVVEANLMALRAALPGFAVVNVGSGEGHTVNELLKMLGKIMEVDAAAEHLPPRPGEVRHSRADIGRARELLGYAPQVEFEEGLRRVATWYREKAATAYVSDRRERAEDD